MGTIIFWELVVALIWGGMWGWAVNAIVVNKGYQNEGTKWFWLGFFLGLFALIVALTKPRYERPPEDIRNGFSTPASNRPPVQLSKEREEEILDRGGWRCTCGRVNQYFVVKCPCGRTKGDALAEMQGSSDK